jgi:RHS repeat-associated protein
VVWCEGAGLSSRHYLVADERGSVIADSDSSGNVTSAYGYSAYGQPKDGVWSGSRFRYTGQTTLPEAQLYYYKARVYDPSLGRFLQTDPLGFGGGDMNLYAYVGGDPVNLSDPSGLDTTQLPGFTVPPPSNDPYDPGDDVCRQAKALAAVYGAYSYSYYDNTPEPWVDRCFGRLNDDPPPDGGNGGGGDGDTDAGWAPLDNLKEELRRFGCKYSRITMFGGAEYSFLYGTYDGRRYRDMIVTGDGVSANLVGRATILRMKLPSFQVEGGVHLHFPPGRYIQSLDAFVGDYGFSSGDLDTAKSAPWGIVDNYVVHPDRAYRVTQAEALAGQTGKLFATWSCPKEW